MVLGSDRVKDEIDILDSALAVRPHPVARLFFIGQVLSHIYRGSSDPAMRADKMLISSCFGDRPFWIGRGG